MKRLINFFRKNFFDQDLPFEYRIYMIFFMESFGISILSATTNTLLGKGILGIVLQWSFILFCLVVMFVPLKTRMRMSKPLLIFTTLVYVPFLFFQTAGYEGTALQFSLLGIFVLVIVFRGRQRVFLVALNTLIYVAICVAQYLYPGLIVPHATKIDRLIDLLVALVLSIWGLFLMAAYISDAFNIERKRIVSLLDELRENNHLLAEMSNRDALTGVYNRRYLDHHLTREMGTASRTNATIYVMMMDLDFFKNINDTYGHGFGDEVLISFTKAVQHVLRPYDTLARIGGEEFLVVLHNITESAALIIAERARQAVGNIEFRNEVRVTVSIGLAKSRPEDTPESLLERADMCLYKAKQSGRNKVVTDDMLELPDPS